MNKEKIEIILKELKELEFEKRQIDSRIYDTKEKLLPSSYEIKTEMVDLEHLGHYNNYYFISYPHKVIGKDWYTEEDAILDAWNHYIEFCNKK